MNPLSNSTPSFSRRTGIVPAQRSLPRSDQAYADLIEVTRQVEQKTGKNLTPAHRFVWLPDGIPAVSLLHTECYGIPPNSSGLFIFSNVMISQVRAHIHKKKVGPHHYRGRGSQAIGERPYPLQSRLLLRTA